MERWRAGRKHSSPDTCLPKHLLDDSRSPRTGRPSKESTMKLRTLSLVYSISTLAMAVFVLGAPYKL